MLNLSEALHEEDRPPRRNGIKPRVSNKIGPGALSGYGNIRHRS